MKPTKTRSIDETIYALTGLLTQVESLLDCTYATDDMSDSLLRYIKRELPPIIKEVTEFTEVASITGSELVLCQFQLGHSE